jgi:alkanesulfonate monooxygenase SsuD/methylene tetrahydromethanopterin reductase-like flavin-dependent oxidoreductase (luciferase family)
MTIDPSAPGDLLHLGFWMLTSGGHVGSWRHPATRPDRLLSIDHYLETTRIAARGKFDMVFFEDTLATRERNGGVFGEVSINSLDPLVQIAALAGATSDIGLAASFSTTYHSPRVLADKFATIDRLSGGRAGWNMVTSGAAAGRNFGNGDHPEHAVRYSMAHETVDTVRRFWAEGPGSPQGRPVLIQAGMSQWGLDFAATYGEAIFAAFRDIEGGRAFRTNLRTAGDGQGPLARRGQGAARLHAADRLDLGRDRGKEGVLSRADPAPGMVRGMLGERFNFDFTDYDLDRPFPLDEIMDGLEDRPMIGGDRARFVKEIQPGDTIGSYAERMAQKLSGHLTCEGSPEDIADFMQAWLQGGACDGFIMQALQIPVELELFVDQVVPVLQRRGLHRTDYAGSTLRGHLGLEAVG